MENGEKGMNKKILGLLVAVIVICALAAAFLAQSNWLQFNNRQEH